MSKLLVTILCIKTVDLVPIYFIESLLFPPS